MSQVAIKGAKPPKVMLAKLLAIDTPDIALGREQVQPFTDKQIALFRDYAAPI